MQGEPGFGQSLLWNNSTPEMMLLLCNQIHGLDRTASSIRLTEQSLETSLCGIISYTTARPSPSTQESGDVNSSCPDSLKDIIDNESTLATNEKMNLEDER